MLALPSTKTKETQEHPLLLVDFDADLCGIEDPLKHDVYVRHTCGHAGNGEFRCVSKEYALAVAYGGADWNPTDFYGGVLAESVVGPLAVVEAILGRRLWSATEVTLGKGRYLVRPCQAQFIPLRLWERAKLRSVRAQRQKERMTAERARRLCFAARQAPKPERVYFAKGTAWVFTPPQAVARLGSSEDSMIVLLDQFARPIAAYQAYAWDGMTQVRCIPIPERLPSWERLRPLGRSLTDTLFGVAA